MLLMNNSHATSIGNDAALNKNAYTMQSSGDPFEMFNSMFGGGMGGMGGGQPRMKVNMGGGGMGGGGLEDILGGQLPMPFVPLLRCLC